MKKKHHSLWRFFWLVGVGIVGAAQMAGAGFTISPSTLKSTGPCLYAVQLQNSESVRNQFTAKLIAAIGGTVSASNTSGIDSLSAVCLSCHDGVSALSITANLKNNPYKESRLRGRDYKMVGMDHPIGMDYNKYAASSKDYKPISATNNKMIFVNDKVGCLTCHNPLIPEKGHLVMSDRNSALCLTCHND